MANLYFFCILSAFTFGRNLFPLVSANYTNPLPLVERLFLDLPLQEVISNTSTMNVVEPWASMYVDAINDGRFGDAVWARYQILGNVENGIIEGANLTVLETIKEDAVEYKANTPEQYEEAVLFYANTSSADGHFDVINTILHISLEDMADHWARVSYGTRCSNGYLAFTTDCRSLINRMYHAKVLIGDIRAISNFGSCHLRVGPYHEGADLTYQAAYAAAILIENECTRETGCCGRQVVSGWSPRNSGHRKVCLSSKNEGCSG
ncbi:hypothetical protein B0J13DRAFT_550330 [Dactylonectria estremocensis]|uniref:WD-like domain-containing protein n=1 Tax=Dactylonectria estremocensis TaxID=1079267 RepID=A0A9P9JC02_9HYPO|nr:hypothetical protein B0J13DRAFT_550330 [Dactylonectria estremocensis]